MRKLVLRNDALDFMEGLGAKQFRQIGLKCYSLRRNPLPNDAIKLKGSKDRYRVDFGEYRIVYIFNDEEVDVQTAGKRNDDEVYK